MNFAQIGILLCGLTAIALTQSTSSARRRYACIFGLLGQPFWFYEALRVAQWGTLIIVTLYGINWAVGFYRFWIRGIQP